MNQIYRDTARLLTQIAPLVFADATFALKGGTAINLFIRDMPRLSVDLDLVFTDHRVPREQAFARIGGALRQASERLAARGFRTRTQATADATETKLLVRRGPIEVKVEVNFVMRGTVHPVARASLVPRARDALLADLEIPIVSFADVYGGKLVAAMDDRVDVLVRGRRLVDHARVLAAFHALGGGAVIVEREAALGLAAAHRAARAVRARREALRVALAAHDVAARAHAARDDAELAQLRAHSALARDEHVFAEVAFLLHVVVMAVDRLDVALEALADERLRGLDHAAHHHLAVQARELLRPADGAHVVAEVLRALLEVGEVVVRQVGVVAQRVLVAEAAGVSTALIHNHYPDVAEYIRGLQGKSSRAQRNAKHEELVERAKSKVLRGDVRGLQLKVRALTSINETLIVENAALRARGVSGKVVDLSSKRAAQLRRRAPVD